jgi:hypothetical protein
MLDYIRDLRSAKWGPTVILQGNKSESPMSQLGQKRTLVGVCIMSALPQKRTLIERVGMSALCQ